MLDVGGDLQLQVQCKEKNKQMGLKASSSSRCRKEQTHAREILDSRGNPTVEVDVRLSDGAFGPRRRAVRREHRRARGRRAARRRPASATAARACSPRVVNVNRDDRPEVIGHGRGRPGGDSTAKLIALDGTPNKERARRERDPRRVAGERAGRGRIGRRCRCTDTSAARRRARCRCRCSTSSTAASTPTDSTDFQEFMVMPVGAASFKRGPALGGRGLSRAREGAEEAGPPDERRRRGRLRAVARRQRAGDRGHPRGDRAGRLQARKEVAIALDPASSELYDRSATATCCRRRAAR